MRRFAIHGSSLSKPSALAALVEPASVLAFGTVAAAATHFSATFWSSTSRVVVTRRPPRFSASQPASSPHTRCGELVTDGPHEMRGDPARRGLAGELDLLVSSRR